MARPLSDQELLPHLKAVADVRVEHPTWLEAKNEIFDLHAFAGVRQDGTGVAIIGESGSGKTTLLRAIQSMFPSRQEKDRDIIPCLLASVPPRPTIKSLAQAILISLGDPLASVRSQSTLDLSERIIALLKGVRCELLLLDELNHLVDGRRSDSLASIADWIKTLADDSRIPFVLAGLPQAQQAIDANIQLQRRFSSTIQLQLVHDAAKPDLADFRGVLLEVAKYLPFPAPTPLWEKDLASRLYFATDARLGPLMRLIDMAIRIGMRQDKSRLDHETFALAFRRAIWRSGVGIRNPFDQNFNWRPLVGAGEPYQPAVMRSTPRKKAA